MNNLWLYLLESGAGLLVFYAFYALLLQRETGFAYNRCYLLVTPILACGLPFVEWSFWPQSEPLTIFITEPLAPLTVATQSTAPTSLITRLNWQTGLLLFYVAGAIILILRLLRQWYRLYQFTRQTRADCFYWQNIPVHPTHGAQPTFSFGSVIFFDNSQALSAVERERVLRHEAVHVRQKHTWDILYLEVLRVLFWFNPLLYLYQKALTSTHEFAADAIVLQTTPAAAYAALLAKQLFHRLNFSFGHYFNKSLTLKRMHMLQQTHRRPNTLKQLLALPVLGLVVFMLSCAETESPVKDPAAAESENQSSAQTIPEDEVFMFVEQNPDFPGGTEKLFEFLGENIKYPVAAKNANLEGMVIAQFIVTKEGKIQDVTIVKGLSPETDAEAKRVIALMPDWAPGKQDGKPLHVKYTLPIRFYLNNASPQETEGQTTAVDVADEIPDEIIFTKVEQNPTFPGGLEKMYAFLGKNIEYPQTAAKANLQGNVIAQFIVTKEGKIEELKIEKSLSPEIDAEALRVIKLMPNWTPGKQNGRAVNVQYTLPIRFELRGNTSNNRAQPVSTGYFNWAKPLQDRC